MNIHEIQFQEPTDYERLSGIGVIIQCDTCHSPDDFGAGSARFAGADDAEAWDKYEEHLEAA